MSGRKDYDQYEQGRHVPAKFAVWIKERPVINSIICLAAGFVAGYIANGIF